MATALGTFPVLSTSAAEPSAAAIVFEDATATSGINWPVLPREKHLVRPGTVYCGWQSDVFLCDIDGDGHLDLISPVHHSSESTPGGIWLGKGDGTFGSNLMDKYPVHDDKAAKTWIYCMYGVGVDINGDGRLDFFVTEPGASYLNEGVEGVGHQRLVRFVRQQTPTGGSRTCIFGDFNRDGNLDLACAGQLFLGGGKGTSPKDWKVHPQATEIFRQRNTTAQYGAFHQGVSADFDRDGALDLLINPSLLGKGKTEPRPRTLLYINDGQGNFTEQAETLGLIGGPPQGPLVAADLNNDGCFDIIAAGRGNGTDDLTRKITLYVNEGAVGLTICLNRPKNDNGWLEVAVRGKPGNTCGVGSLIEVFQAGKLGDRAAYVGMQHVTTENDSHVPIAPHFGLGKAKAVDIRVTLPTGEVLETSGVKAKSRAVADFQAGTFTTSRPT